MKGKLLPLLGFLCVVAAIYGALGWIEGSQGADHSHMHAPLTATSAAPGARAAGTAVPQASRPQAATVDAQRRSPSPPSAAAKGAAVDIFFAGNAAGELTDCGCRANPLGGLARRVQQVLSRPLATTVHLDAGGSLTADSTSPPATEEQRRAHTELYLKALALSQVRALNVAPAELAMGTDTLIALGRTLKVPLLASNTTAVNGARTAFRRMLETQVGGVRIAVLGLTSNRRLPKGVYERSGLKLRDPIVAARELARGVRDKVDVIIALSWLTIEEIDDLGAQVPEIDFVLGCRDTDLLRRAERLGRGYRLDGYHKGKWLGQLTLRRGRGASSQWYDPSLREAIETQLRGVQREVDFYALKHKKEDAAGGPKDKSSRRFEKERSVGLQARLTRLRLELKGLSNGTSDAKRFSVQLLPVKPLWAEHPQVAEWVKAFQAKYPGTVHR